MADQNSKIAVSDLSALLPEDVTTSHQVIVFTQDGDTNRVEFKSAVVDAIGGISIYQPYKTTTNISASGSGTTLTIPTATYAGDVSNVSVWDGDVLLRPMIVKGLSGSDKTVTIITNKAYTGARVTVTFE